MDENWKIKGKEGKRLNKKGNYFHVLGKCFLPSEEIPIYNRVAVLREVVGGSSVKTAVEPESLVFPYSVKKT